MSKNLNDTYRHKGMRRKLIQALREKGIRDEGVLAAMEALPRHFFLEKAFEEWAYKDKPFPIGEGQTISQPYTVAYQTALLEVSKRQKVLEVGTGSGYQAAVLALMGARVYTVERHEPLYQRAKEIINFLRLTNVRCFYRDGYKGLPEHAPFDRILVTAGAREVPEALLQQLAVGGLMVIPLGEKIQTMYRIARLTDKEYRHEAFHTFQFVPFLKGLDHEE